MARATKKVKKPALARPGDPYVAHTGQLFYPEGLPPEPSQDDEPKLTASEYRPLVQRSAKDLPAPMQTMHCIACVVVYTVLGLGVREIADALNVDISVVERAKEHQAYDETFQALASEFINANSNLISARIAAASHGAVSSLVDIAHNGKQEGNKMRASIDLLDRAGHSKKTPHGIDGANDLRIVITRGDQNVEVQMGNLGDL